jgi:histidinol dehydrogenase
VRCERFALTGDAAPLAGEIRALTPDSQSVAEAVAEIVAQVRAHGDEALLEYTRRLDTDGADPRPLRVADTELEAALGGLDQAVQRGLERTIENVSRVAESSPRSDATVSFEGHQVTLRETPVERAAVYVPGGRAPYPSTVAMGVVTARVAGVPDVAVCAPPARDGDIQPVVLAACRLTGASVVYRMGGAQAIAALAYGTHTVTPVDVIVGPGNLYVQEAKRQVFGQVGIDGFAGPSDLMVIADPQADPRLLTLDLLAQAEHGPGTLVVGVSGSMALLDALHAELDVAPETGAVACLVHTPGSDQALELAQAFAPEHLQLVGPTAEGLAAKTTHAGCVFVGAGAGTAFGDYIAGSNHVLPTGGAARFASALSPAHFRRRFAEVRIPEPSELARAAAPLARAEGFELHARSMEARIRDNGTADGPHR